MTYKELYDFGRKELQGGGIIEADLDARLLLEAICHTGRNDLLVYGDRIVDEIEEINYVKYIDQRRKHTPLQYVTGKQEFMGLEFTVNESVLIPRQDTEILVEEAMLVIHDGMRILDICTGSGCILLSLLHYKNDCTGVGLDISQEALKVAFMNADRLGIKAEFLESDLLVKVQGKFDVVLSNPPYIRSDVLLTLMQEVKDHEPLLALDGKEDGLYFYRKIVKDVKLHLHKGSMLLFEIGYDQAEDVRKLMKDAGFSDIKTIKDFAGLDRVVSGIFLEDICLTN